MSIRRDGESRSGSYLLQRTDADGNEKVLAAFCDFSLKANDPSFETVIGTAAMEEKRQKPVKFVLSGEGDISDNAEITFNKQEYGAEYTTLSNFIAPSDGKYRLAFSATAYQWSVYLQIIVDGVEVVRVYDQLNSSSSGRSRGFSAVYVRYLSQGNVVSLRAQCSIHNNNICFKRYRLFEGELLS